MKTMKSFYFFGLLLTLGTASAVFTSCGDGDNPDNPVIGGLVLPEMVTVAGGSTTLGGTKTTISSFQIGKYEVTQKLWKDVMGSWPGTTTAIPSSSYGVGNNYPMYYVSHDDVQTFLAALNTKTGKNYRLPTAAEWEYAAKGGQSTHNYEYSGSNTIGAVAWYEDNSGGKTHPVGTKAANELGIHDMSGNVWEWCSDWYDDFYREDRGGSWYDSAAGCRVSGGKPAGPATAAAIVASAWCIPFSLPQGICLCFKLKRKKREIASGSAK